MEDFNKKESRKALTAELEVQKNYLELVPRPNDEDYQRLKENIAQNGFDEAKPIVVTEDLVVLDGHTRLEIAKELGEEWVHVIVKDLPDHYAEKRYIIETNLDQRHLNPAQRAELGKKLLEIKRTEARERQRQAGDQNLKQNQIIKENISMQTITPYPVPPILAEPEKKGEAIEITADQIMLGKESLRKSLKIMEAAETDPEIAEAWEQAKEDKVSINQVYQQVQEKQEKAGKKPKKQKKPQGPFWQPTLEEVLAELNKPTYFERMMEDVPLPEPYPDEELMEAVYHVAELKGIPREAIDGGIELEKQIGPGPVGESDTMYRWRKWSQGVFDPEIAWDLMMIWVERWQKEQRAARPEEVPVPDDSKKLGPWPLDYVHQAGLENLVRDFPCESAHLIYSDATVDLEQFGLLGQFAARALTAGKYLCVYVDKRHLPEAMARLSAAGLTYFWSCMVFRQNTQKVEELMIKDIWRLMLIYRKGETDAPPWDWFYDSVKSLTPMSRDLVRQLLKGLTHKGQMVVDPYVGSGVTGQAARSLGRRFLCFGANEEDVRAANQRIAELRLAEESGT